MSKITSIIYILFLLFNLVLLYSALTLFCINHMYTYNYVNLKVAKKSITDLENEYITKKKINNIFIIIFSIYYFLIIAVSIFIALNSDNYPRDDYLFTYILIDSLSSFSIMVPTMSFDEIFKLCFD